MRILSGSDGSLLSSDMPVCRAHVNIFQEHSLPTHQPKRYEAEFRGAKKKILLSDLDPDVKAHGLAEMGNFLEPGWA